MGSETETYGYRGASALLDHRLVLQTAGGRTVQGPAAHPRFFTGFAVDPRPTAAGLVVLADLARTDFRRSRQSLDGTWRGYRDPVVTGDGERLRFEALSGCCGGYARLDLLPSALDGQWLGRGTTNVDINPPLYTALTRVGAGDPLRLSVGPDDLTVATLDGAVVEKRVPLPQRWLRGLAEVPAVAAGFELRAELPAAEAHAFLQRLPVRGGAEVRWLMPVGRSLRAGAAPLPGAVCLAAPHRLAVLRPLLRFARALRLYGPTARAGSPALCSGWELDLGMMRFWLMLSPATNRGFSGEGRLLDALAGGAPPAPDAVPPPQGGASEASHTGAAGGTGDVAGLARAVGDADLVGGLLGWEPTVDVAEVAARSGLTPDRVRAALAVLAGSGQVGYDCAEVGYFHRELPYAPERVATLHPRLTAARALAGADTVRRRGDDLEVVSGDRSYLVHRTADGRLGCTCPWWSAHRGGRGPCKHVLAATITEPTLTGGAR
ncbi:SWIM zinc finger family protein [Plantactinospora sonchi]|uniref:SWIM zinc finger family protein n=1 Tax=Plantactinospora sonchi TaxID=1544735 RepID=A0ABU7RQH1_9ACTN